MRNLAWLLLLPIGLVACGPSDDASRAGPLQFNAGEPAVRVNELPVSGQLLEAVARGRNFNLARPEHRQRAVQELTDYILLAQAAAREGIDATDEFRAQVEAARLQGVANAMMLEYQKLHPVTDEMLRAEYDQQIAKAGSQTYDFTQLLYDNEAEALKAAEQIVAGTEFAKVYDGAVGKAKQAKSFKSARLAQLPAPELVDAIAALKPGESTKLPVRTRFGWHLIRLDATSPYTPPPFDQLKSELHKALLARQSEAYIDRLRKEALILDLNTPASAPVPAPAPQG
jgi:peptidyl-prolyl cis-trans isomerase C